MNKIDELFLLNEHVAVVVGGAGQLGRATTKVLLEANSKGVAVVDLPGSNLDSFVAEMDNVYPGRVMACPADITSKDELEKVKNSIMQRWNRIDVLINHAHFKGDPRKLKPGSPFFAKFEEYPLEIWQEAIEVNLTGLFLACQIFGAEMVKKSSGSIINTASTYGIVSPNQNIYGDSGINNPISYATTKGAIINFTRYLATYWAPKGIRVNTLSPGGILNNGQSDEFRVNYNSLTPMGRMAREDEYQGAVLFLASKAASYMTGANLVVDGGWTAW